MRKPPSACRSRSPSRRWPSPSPPRRPRRRTPACRWSRERHARSSTEAARSARATPRPAGSRRAPGRTSATRASIAHRDWVFTGCISTDGRVKLDEYNLATGQRRLLTLFRGLEVDDHNNPSLVFFRDKLYAFASEHAGYVYPRDRNSRMQYRVSKRDWGAGRGWGRTRTIPLERRLRARLHLPQPGRVRQAAVPVHARPLLVPVLHVDEDGKTWARRGRSCSGRRARAATCARTRSTTRRPTARS